MHPVAGGNGTTAALGQGVQMEGRFGGKLTVG